MRFDELDSQMRIYETAADYCVLPGMYMVARLDGRSFTRLTKAICHDQRGAHLSSRLPEISTAGPALNELLVRIRLQGI